MCVVQCLILSCIFYFWVTNISFVAFVSVKVKHAALINTKTADKKFAFFEIRSVNKPRFISAGNCCVRYIRSSTILVGDVDGIALTFTKISDFVKIRFDWQFRKTIVKVNDEFISAFTTRHCIAA
ncbi:hypothetical protein CRENPOLYSF1_440041 [Crenothrix polyspora]|uniref:Uncharacterized protein n=1 Tax=Crenothrix polyspora TaxID=360316 RepID=A0A1R4HBE5_9GAMM|nr:hypothetical protein CRENPOLYSF1_440041 [Crenothrix polyspora]